MPPSFRLVPLSAATDSLSSRDRLLYSSHMMNQLLLALFVLFNPAPAMPDITGAWQMIDASGNVSTMILTDEHFSVAVYTVNPHKFRMTRGGTWEWSGEGEVAVTYEFETADPSYVGQTLRVPAELDANGLVVGGHRWTRVDDGTPGALEGAWLITGRKRDGEISTRTPGARRTMKILSGSRFQWIAYNVETKEFFGTGGGTYTTENGRYTENIEFFSRDDSKAGRSLEFGYDVVDGVWHHDGKSTSGDPMYELWTPRAALGI